MSIPPPVQVPFREYPAEGKTFRLFRNPIELPRLEAADKAPTVVAPRTPLVIDTYYYSALTVSHVKFGPGVRHFIEPASGEKRCLGILLLSGSWELHRSKTASSDEDLGWHAPDANGQWPIGFWNNYGAHDYAKAQAAGVEWLCIEENDTGARSIDFEEVDGRITIPAGCGAIIGSGNFELDDQQSETANFFRIDDYERKLFGAGQVLLVA